MNGRSSAQTRVADAIERLKADHLTILDLMGGRKLAASLGVTWED